ncbi:MAG: hypothetical protein IKZ95_07580 [Lachnospiraceae bacterium]|nr:hypothetical protein [Lachnospiraceae bacterium]
MDTRISTLIESVENKAKAIYSYPEIFVSAGGSSAGILAAITALPEGRILVARNCRKAVFDAMSLTRRNVRYLYPEEIYPGSFIYGGIEPDRVEERLKNHGEIKAVVITSPTPEGVLSDVELLADICHEYGAVLIVDESLGAHLPYHEDFPTSAIFLGADVVIHDLSRTLPAREQSALVFVNTEMELTRKIKVALDTYSPDNVEEEFLTNMQDCLDWAFREEDAFTEYLNVLAEFREKFAQIDGLRLMGRDLCGTKGIYDLDEGRLCFRKDGVTGIALGDFLRDEQGIALDGAGISHVIIPTPIRITRNDFRKIYKALLATAGMPKYQSRKEYTRKQMEQISLLAVAKTGKEYRDFIYVYPPGCPVIAPGEIYTKEKKEQITDLIDKGAEIAIWERYFS